MANRHDREPDTGIASARAFFGPRAATWEDRFPDDEPLYAQAVAELTPPAGGIALDAGCGTGRALPALRAWVGTAGTVLAVDVTAQMLAEVRRRRRDRFASLLIADVNTLPLASGSVDAVFAGGLFAHLTDPVADLAEFARVCRPEARLALFHPTGRASLARRHRHELDPDDIHAEPHIHAALTRSGWRCESVDDAEDRYLTLAVRHP